MFSAKPLPLRPTSDHRTLKRKQQASAPGASTRPSAHGRGRQCSRLLAGVAGRPRALAEAASPGLDGPLFKEHKAADRQTPYLGQCPALEGEPPGAPPEGSTGQGGQGRGRSQPLPPPQALRAHKDRGSTQEKPPREEPARRGGGPPSADTTLAAMSYVCRGLLAASRVRREKPHTAGGES